MAERIELSDIGQWRRWKNGSGIYRISCVANGMVYIGSAVDLKKRLCVHLGTLRAGNSCNLPLQRAWNKYGELSFSVEIVERLIDPSREAIRAREQHWIDSVPKEQRFNILPFAFTAAGHVQTPEHRARIGGALRGKPKSLAARQAMSTAAKGRIPHNKGKPWSKEVCDRISAANKGLVRSRPFTAEHRAKIAAALRAYCARTPAAREARTEINRKRWAKFREAQK